MTLETYLLLGEQDARFDGHIARMHLERRLRYRAVPSSVAEGALMKAFRRWEASCSASVSIPRDGVLLVPPDHVLAG
jgi:hypothetical protein